MKFRTFCCVLLLSMPICAAAQTTEDVLGKVYKARGGLEKIRAVQGQRVSGTISFGSDAEGPFVVELKRPLKMHMELTVQQKTMVRVFDGKMHGWANNPFAGKEDPEAMGEADLQNISEESDFDGPLVDYKSKGDEIELVGKDKERVDGKDVWRLKLTIKTGEVRYYLFDAESYLLLKWEGKRKFNGQEFPVESYFKDYRDVDGLKFAFEIDSGTSASDINQKIIIDKIELNPSLEDSRFAQPPTPAPPTVAPTEAPKDSPPSLAAQRLR